MPKSTGDFRKIDVDQYTEDNYEEDSVLLKNEETFEIYSTLTDNLIQQGQHLSAFKNLLSLPCPQTDLVLRVALSVRPDNVRYLVECLKQDECDELLRCVFTGFERAAEGQSTQLLAWHRQITDMAGSGALMRALARH